MRRVRREIQEERIASVVLRMLLQETDRMIRNGRSAVIMLFGFRRRQRLTIQLVPPLRKVAILVEHRIRMVEPNAALSRYELDMPLA